MYNFNFWNQFHLFRKEVLILLILLFTGTFTYGQKRHLHLTNVDKKDIHFGFQVGAFRSYMNVVNSDASSDPNNIVRIIPSPEVGFTLGFIFNMSLADELWDLRILPNVSFYNRVIEINTNIENNTLETSVFEVPILLQYKSIRRGNTRMYLVGGVTAGIEVGGKNKGRVNDENLMALNTFNFELTYGIGLDKYLEFVKFSPELRFSHSINNLLQKNGSDASNFIDKITTNRVSLIINFEG